MSDKKEILLDYVLKHNVSAIVTLSEKAKLRTEEVTDLLGELVAEGRLHGSFSEEGTRFYRSDAKVSEAPIIHREDKEPEFLRYNTRPGYLTAIIGGLILVGGTAVNIYATDRTEQDFAAVLFLVGIVVLFAGLFFVAKRKTPS